MPRFLVTYHGSGMPTDPAQLQQVKTAFEQWVATAGNAIIDPGAPLRPAGQVANGSPAPRAGIGGYSIIETATAEAATDVLRSHPFVARGGTLQMDEVVGV